MSALSLQQSFQLAIQHHQAGRLQQAEQLYRQILAQQPANADAMHLLGVVAAQVGRNDAAIDLIRRALALKPNQPEFHNNLGNALKEMKRPEEAADAFRKAISLHPNYPDALSNLGNALKDMGLLDDAIASYRQAITLKPNYPEAYNNLGTALREKGDLEKALAACRQALALRPNYPEAHYNLGNALKDSGQLDPAIAAFRQAVNLNPQFALAHLNLGLALKDRGRLDEALASLRQAVTINPDDADTHTHLGNLLRIMGYLDEAAAAFKQTIALNPEDLGGYNNLGGVLKDSGQIDAAIAVYRDILAKAPAGPIARDIHSNLCYMLQYHPNADPAAILEEHRRWDQRHAQQLKHLVTPHANDRSPAGAARRLRIGYVAPDFCQHCQSFFTIPLLSCHDHTQFEIFCYSSTRIPDHLTQRIASCTDTFRPVDKLSDEQLADLIRQDKIDILVNLTMHMALSRLLVFAQKPAPVQVTWLAYPGTTGLSTMDYRLTDPYLDPPGIHDDRYSEKSIRLPHTFWCYDPLIEKDKELLSVSPLPALANHHITFGCLNNPCKLNPDVLALWSSVLNAVPNARLLLYSHLGAHRQTLLDTLAIDPARIEFLPKQPRAQYLKTFHRIDIALDTFPYNGHTTSLDSFYMGVPVITLTGPTIVGRAGLSQLTNLNLPELVASTPDQYLQIATTLANDLPRLANLRATLRDRMQSSPLMNAQLFAQNIEAAYRTVWQQWCAANPV